MPQPITRILRKSRVANITVRRDVRGSKVPFKGLETLIIHLFLFHRFRSHNGELLRRVKSDVGPRTCTEQNRYVYSLMETSSRIGVDNGAFQARKSIAAFRWARD